MARIPRRITTAVADLGVTPGSRVIEFGGGRGASAELICEALDDGVYVGVDRSEKATIAAAARNAASVESGLARFVTASIAGFDAQGETFDRVLAVNVNVFWTGPATVELRAIAGLLTPGGRLVLCYEPPDRARSAQVEKRLSEHLPAAGFHSEFRPYGHLGRAILVVVATV